MCVCVCVRACVRVRVCVCALFPIKIEQYGTLGVEFKKRVLFFQYP